MSAEAIATLSSVASTCRPELAKLATTAAAALYESPTVNTLHTLESSLAFLTTTTHDASSYRRTRRLALELNLTDLDLPEAHPEHTFRDQIALQMGVGYIDLELRDILDRGHARALEETARSQEWDASDHLSQTYAMAMTEPRSGTSVMRTCQTIAVPEPNGFRLSGKKTHISRFLESDLTIVLCRTPNRNLGLAILPSSQLMRSYEQHDAQGLTNTSWGSLKLDDVQVPEHSIITHDVENLLRRHFSRYRLIVTALLLGSARRALDEIRSIGERLPASRKSAVLAAYAERLTSLDIACMSHTALLGQVAQDSFERITRITTPEGLKVSAHQLATVAWSLAGELNGASSFRLSSLYTRQPNSVRAYTWADGANMALSKYHARKLLGVSK